MEETTPDVVPVRIEPPGLEGLLGDVPAPLGVVVFAHGSGSGRLSPRNNFVAQGLRRAGCVTLLLDLLRPEEEAVRSKVFDIPLLAERLGAAVRWVRQQPHLHKLPIGLFGASTGGGAALLAAADMPGEIAAVVSRGGRPDLAGDALPRVRAPTLLLVGGRDTVVIELNRAAYARMTAEKELVLVPNATHLFEEPGTLEQVLDRAAGWFIGHLGAAGAAHA